MELSEYLHNLISSIPQIKDIETGNKQNRNLSIDDLIYSKLVSRKFRTKIIPQELEEKVRKIIYLSVKEEKPLHFTIPFGGYKLWKFPTYPGPDFAELFNLIQLRSYLSRITQLYKPGVILEYWSDEIMVSKMNNYPQSDLDIYNNTFEEMINWFSSYLPINFSLKFNKIRNKITYDEYQRFTEDYIKLHKPKWEQVSKEQQNIRLKKAERNYRGDLSEMNEAEKYELLLNSTLRHDAFIFGDWDNNIPWAFDKLMIPLGFQYTGVWGIPIKSSFSSMTQFWVGMGIVKKYNSSYVPSILTFNQYIQIKDQLEFKSVNIFPKKFNNLQRIAVYDN